MRVNRSIKFPYKTHKGIACPIIPIEISGIRLDTYVDSGAFYSIFSTKEAEVIGIKYQTGKPASAIVGAGAIIPVFYHTLTIKIGYISFPATIGFSSRLGVGFNLLGRKDIFERFIVIFDDAKKQISFIPNKHKYTCEKQ